MTDRFFERPVLNSPYDYPARHWELDERGQPTNRVAERRRQFSFVTPIPRPKKRKGGQDEIVFDETARALSADGQRYDLAEIIGSLRRAVDRWRALPEAQRIHSGGKPG